MIDNLITWLLVTWVVCGGIVLASQLIGAICYEVQQIWAERRYKQHPHARQYRQRPLVSVIIRTHNQEDDITPRLASIVASTYRKYQIIIVDEASTDSTPRQVRAFQRLHPKKPIRLIARRSVHELPDSLEYAQKTRLTGELVMILEARDLLTPSALTKSVQQLNTFPSVDGLLPQRRLGAAESSLGLFQKYLQLLLPRLQKARSMWYPQVEPAPRTVVLRAAVLPRLKSQQPLSLSYAHEVCITTAPRAFEATWLQHMTPPRPVLPAISEFSTPLNTVRSLFAVGLLRTLGNAFGIFRWLTPLVVTYFFYLAIHLHQVTFLAAAWGMLIAVIIAAIWGDEQLRLRHKLAYLFGMPLTFGYFYLITWLPFMGAARWLARRVRKLLIPPAYLVPLRA